MAYPIDITGRRFGRLIALKPQYVKGERRWLCDCDCGKQTVVGVRELNRGNTRSCGCLNRIRLGFGKTPRHGARRLQETTSTYQTWRAMRGRCLDPKHKDFFRYGGRGIAICDRWHVFENFRADMGERPDGLTLDRINNDGDYEPGNCRWATAVEQRRNRRR